MTSQRAQPTESTSKRWAKVPLVILDLKLSRDDLRAFVALSAHADGDRETRVGQETLARLLGVDRRSVRRTLKRLESAGVVVKVASGRGRPDRYRVKPFDDQAQ